MGKRDFVLELQSRRGDETVVSAFEMLKCVGDFPKSEKGRHNPSFRCLKLSRQITENCKAENKWGNSYNGLKTMSVINFFDL